MTVVRGSTFARVPLRGLTADEVQRMMTTIASQPVSYGLSEAVYRQTEGNPLAAGLIAFGAYAVLEARWRRLLER